MDWPMSERSIEDVLDEALERLEDAINYKGDYLAEKHGDKKFLEEARAFLKQEHKCQTV